MKSVRCVGAALGAAMVLGAGSAAAQQPLSVPVEALVDAAFIADVRDWAAAPVVVLALEGRAARVGRLEPAEIDALDRQWRAERTVSDQPLITSVLASPVSSYLTRIQAASIGLYTEIFVMDANGLNIGQSAVTSDYWQGDEAKFQKTFGAGAGAVFLDAPEFHDGSRTWRAQLNMTIDDPSGAPAGAVTVEINLSELERRIHGG